MQYFLWIIYQFWGFFLLFCGRKIFSKTKSLFPTFHNSTIQCSYPFGDDYYNGFFTINYMIDFSGQFCQTKVLNEKFWAISLTELWNLNKDFQNSKEIVLNFSISNTAQWSIFSNIQDTFVLVVKIKLKEQTFSDKFNIFELHW